MTRIFSLSTLLFFLASPLAHAEQRAHSQLKSIQIHTDNPSDHKGLTKEGEFAPGITIDSNLLALNAFDTKFDFRYMTLKRSMIYMDRGDSICITDRVKTPEREAKYLFSKPVNIFMSRRLYFNDTSKKVPELDANKPVDIVKLFENNKDITLLLSNQMSYGKKLDKLIDKIPQRTKTYRDGAAHDYGILNMFAKKRADFALLFPQQVFGYEIDITSVNYEIAGIKPYIVGYLMCSNTPSMKSFIQQFNQKLDNLYKNGELLNAHLKYLRPQDAKALTDYFLHEVKVASEN
mgnify:CR=1 FL=1